MKTSKGSALAWGGVLSAGILWGGGAVVGQSLLTEGMSPYSLALARFTLGLPLLWWWHLREPRRGAPTTWRERGLVIGTGLMMALSVVSWFAGISVLGAALPTVIAICCAPVLVALVSVVRGFERMTRHTLLALCMALAGVAVMVYPATDEVLAPGYGAGIAWSFAAAVFQAGVVLGNARMPAHVPASTASAWGMTAAAACMALVAFPRGLTWPGDAMGWLGVAYTGIVTTSVAYLLFAWGARRLTPTAAVIGIMVEPLVATLLEAWLFGRPLAPRQWLGALTLVAALVPLTGRAAQRHTSANEASGLP
ncbi:DMT family transporter [Archangium minus]|uniref:DMT family transporter n=1 Tax=Archangium minus TaxID=83450 RepID=A0ABY9WX16_9BACT|nr:DMT family transporter [Archangium minus]